MTRGEPRTGRKGGPTERAFRMFIVVLGSLRDLEQRRMTLHRRKRSYALGLDKMPPEITQTPSSVTLGYLRLGTGLRLDQSLVRHVRGLRLRPHRLELRHGIVQRLRDLARAKHESDAARNVALLEDELDAFTPDSQACSTTATITQIQLAAR